MSEQGSHIGTLIKAHGYKGEIQIKGKPALLDMIQIGDPLFISIDGQRIPFFVEDAFESGHKDRLVIKFEFIDDINTARKFVNCKVYSDQQGTSEHEDGEDYTTMMSYSVFDTNSKRKAEVTDYIESPENPILILTFDQQDVMLPLNADYIESIDHSSRTMRVALPEGLINL